MTIEQLLARKKEISAQLADEKRDFNEEELSTLETELRDINGQIAVYEKRQALAAEAKVINEEGEKKTEERSVEAHATDTGHSEKRAEEKELEERGLALQEKRAVLVSTDHIILPKHLSNNLKQEGFNQISSLIDRVNHMPLNGGESFEQPYKLGITEADYTGEGEAYHEVEVEFGSSQINKTKITAYNELSEEVEKLPAAPYATAIQKGVGESLRMKITRQILRGDGLTGRIVGIFSDKATAIDPETDVTISAIDDKTLDELIFSYGGEENIEDVATLILSKADVKAFATLRDNQDRKVYDVKANGNTGSIDGVPYVINSVCGSIALDSTADGEYCMAYGPLSNYTLATFSPTDIRRSDDYKFREGMIAHRGSVFVGGNVTAHNGFVRVKKGTPTV
jgi:HK97 family phage major capsid protein